MDTPTAQSSVTVTINNPPSTGPNASNTAYVEAIVSKPEPTYFLRVLGVSTMTVSTRAVAYEGNGPNCIYVMNPSASGALSANGNVTVNSSCGLLVDSSSSSGLTVNRQRRRSRAPNIGVVGGYTANGNTSFYADAEDRGDSGVAIRWPTCRRRLSAHALTPIFR